MNASAVSQANNSLESMDCDVVIAGAGPAGLATAIRLKQRDPRCSIVVLEKGAEPGSHIVSGAVMDPRALDELLPGWRVRGEPLLQAVTGEELLVLTASRSLRVPDALMPRNLHNQGCFVVSLSDVVKWLALQAEALGVEVFSGFAATQVLSDEQGRVTGLLTGPMGIGKDGQRTAHFRPGMALRARYTVLAEGARGHLGRQVIARHQLDADRPPQNHAIGIKELWEVPADRARPGHVLHTTGWPLRDATFGGGFLYHLGDRRVSLGLVIGLDYRNPHLSAFEEMQRWKTHPAIRAQLEGGRRIGYGARAINNGTPQAMPKTVFPGGALVGCDAGYLNAARIKGSHAAIKSGMLCADALADALAAGRSHDEVEAYPQAFERSWLHEELQQSRNFKHWYHKSPWVGHLMTGVEQWLLPRLGVHSPPWTLRGGQADHTRLRPAACCAPIDYPKPDGVLSFDRPSSVYLSNTHHEEDQPVHLTLRDDSVPVAHNLGTYAGPEQRYCPAGVYEFLPTEEGGQRLQVNAQNCLHCKTCDIKDPTQNIVWVPPEGGDGPQYAGM